jgi:peptidoglycan-associated lipoprotein
MEISATRSPARRALGLVLFVSAALAIAGGTAGCPKKPPKATPTPEETATPAPTPTATPDLDTVMREGVPTPADAVTLGCGDTPVYFELDSSALTAESTAVVKGVVSCLTANRGWKVTVEGHADERGGTQYNLALGERRARSVADYLKNAAVEGARVTTVSFGEEKPADPGHTEAAWGKNRRVEFRIVK